MLVVTAGEKQKQIESHGADAEKPFILEQKDTYLEASLPSGSTSHTANLTEAPVPSKIAAFIYSNEVLMISQGAKWHHRGRCCMEH